MTQTLDESVARLREWAAGTGKPTPGRFDARDREALRVVLDGLAEERELRESSERANYDEREALSRVMDAIGSVEYGGCYQVKHVLPSVQYALAELRARIAWLERQLERKEGP